MAYWPQKLRRVLGLSAVLFSLLVVQNAFGVPFRGASDNLSPRALYHNIDSLAGVVLTESSHIVGSLQTLYELRKLALQSSEPEQSSAAVFPRSPFPVVQSVLCSFSITPAPKRTEYRCPLSRRG